ncbi:hypothetical protein H9P43_009162 [Blastocladiella emersonii ATCC 22665]|nr:hypothetical protein H9P43_009162 [Blastocladiella emersonii ATCC 22665]
MHFKVSDPPAALLRRRPPSPSCTPAATTAPASNEPECLWSHLERHMLVLAVRTLVKATSRVGVEGLLASLPSTLRLATAGSSSSRLPSESLLGSETMSTDPDDDVYLSPIQEELCACLAAFAHREAADHAGYAAYRCEPMDVEGVLQLVAALGHDLWLGPRGLFRHEQQPGAGVVPRGGAVAEQAATIEHEKDIEDDRVERMSNLVESSYPGLWRHLQEYMELVIPVLVPNPLIGSRRNSVRAPSPHTRSRANSICGTDGHLLAHQYRGGAWNQYAWEEGTEGKGGMPPRKKYSGLVVTSRDAGTGTAAAVVGRIDDGAHVVDRVKTDLVRGQSAEPATIDAGRVAEHREPSDRKPGTTTARS